MPDTLRVLYVDDESGLLEIGKLFLEHSGDFTVTTALSAADGIHLLGQEKFDAIVSDYQMPGMDGIQFLVEVRTRFGPIPFILFTGRGREEVVIQALNSGADFYIQKGGEPEAQFAELAHKIKAAASSKRAEDTLRKSEERYRHLIEHSNEAIIVAQDGMLKLVNHRTIDYTGYSQQELLSMPFSAFIHQDDRAMVVERYQKRLKGEDGPSRYTFRLSSKDGSTRWVELSVVLIDWDGRPATLNFLTDITDRKRAETEIRERQEKFAAAFSINPDPVAITDIGTGTIIEANPAFSQWSGYSPEELIGKTTKDLNIWIDPYDRDDVLASIKAHEIVIDREVRFRIRNGTVRDCLFSARLVSLGGREFLFTSARDITVRKRADEALRISEEKFRKAFFTSPDAICITRMNDGMFVSVNKGFTEITGYTEDDVAGKTSLEINVWKDPEDRRKIVEELMAKGEVRNYEARFLTKTGEISGLMSTLIIELDGVPHILNITHDITERKHAEEELIRKNEELHASYEQLAASEEGLRQNAAELAKSERALRESEKRYRLIDDASLNYIYSYDLAGRFTSANRSLCTAMMLGCDQILGKTHAELGFPDAQCRDWDDLHRKVYDTDTTVTSLTSTPMPDGTTRLYEVVLNPIHDSDGTITGITGTTRDITDRKHAEEALQESEGLLKTVVTNLHGIVFSVDKEGIFILSEGRSLSSLGLTPGQVVGQSVFDVYKDVPEIIAGMKTALSGNPWSGICHVQGIFFDTVVNPVFDSSKMVSGAVGIATDITGRKRAEEELIRKNEELHASYEEIAATGEELRGNLDELTRQEEALRESKRELADIIEFLPDATFVIDRQAIVIAWNRAMEELTGIRAEDMLGKGNYEYAVPFYGERRPILIDLVMIQDLDVLNKYSSVQKEGDSLTAETEMAHLGGKNLFLWGKAILIKNFHGEVVGAIESIRDITAWKHAEKKLVSTQEYLKEAHRLAGIGTWDWVMETDTVTWSEELFNIAGRDTSQPAPTYAEHPWIYSPSSWERLSAAVTNALNTGEPYNLELELIRPDGSIRLTYASGGVIRDTKGTITGLHGTLQDITERKREEEALLASKERFKNLIETISDWVWEVDQTGKYTYVSLKIRDILGYEPDEVIGKTPFDLMPPGESEKVAGTFTGYMKSQKPFAGLENINQHKDGRKVVLETSGVPFFDDEHTLLGYRGIDRDITERKQAEEALRESEEKYRTLVEKANEAIIIAQDGIFAFANRSMSELLGVPVTDLEGRAFIDYIWPDDREWVVENYKKRISGEAVPDAYDFRIIGSGGSLRWVSLSAAVSRWKGKPATINLITDITERKKAEEEFLKSEERFRGLFDTITSGVAIYEVMNDGASGKDYIIKDFNKTALEIEGKKKDEVVGKSLFDLRPAIDDYGLIPVFQQAWKTGVSGYFPQKIYIDEKYSRWYENRVFRLHSGEIVAVYDDVTDRKRAEEALRMSEVQFRSYVDSAPEGIFIADEKGYYIFVNDAACITTGYTREELLSKNLVDVVFPEDIPKAGEHFQSVVKKGSASGELRFITRNGDVRWWVVKGVRLSPTRFLGFTSDTTERKQVEEALALTQSRLETSMEAGNIAWWEMDCITGNVHFNERKARMLGYPAEQFSHYSDFTKLLHPDDYGPAMQAMREHLSGIRKPYEVDYRICASNGGFLWFHDIGRISDYAPDGKPLKVTGIVIDITGRKAAEETLRNSEKYYRTIIQTTKDGFWIIDAHSGRFMDVNETYCAMSGYTKTELLDMGINDIDSVEDPVTTQNRIQRILTNGSELFETRHRRKDGSLLDVEVSVTYFPAEGGKFIYFCRDITGRKRVLEALVESESFNRNLVENLPDYISVYGMDGKLLYVNPASARTLGYDADTLIGTHVLSYIAEEYHETVIVKMRARQEGHEVSPYEIEMVTRNGPRRSVIVKAAPVQYQDNPATLLLLIDITERRQAEEALITSQSQLAEAMGLAHMANWEFDVATGIFTFDDRFYALYATTSELEGGNQMPAEVYAKKFVHPDDQYLVAEEVKKSIQATDPGYVSNVEHRIIRRDGEVRTIVVRFGITKDENGRTVRIHGANQDITERKRAEEALNQANKKLNLLSSVTRHDINNQLTILIGFLAMLEKKQPDPSLSNYFRKISTAAQHISAMIQFTKEYQRIGVVAPAWQNSHTLVDTAANEAPLGHVVVKNYIPEGMAVFADPLIRKVFYNLMDNAVRYGEKITTITFKAEERERDYILVCEDDGVGVIDKEKEKIFERGFGKNTGLGLALSREILDITGITIRETGELGKGARFEMTVPKGMWR